LLFKKIIVYEEYLFLKIPSNLLESAHIFGYGKENNLIYDNLDNTFFQNQSEFFIINENRVGIKKKQTIRRNLCSSISDCNNSENENCVDGYCVKDTIQFETQQTKKYTQIKDYYLYFKINSNYITKTLQNNNRLVIYPAENFNMIQIKNIFQDFVLIPNYASLTENYENLNGVLFVRNIYLCFYWFYCYNQKSFDFVEINEFKEFTEFHQTDSLLEKVYFNVRGIVIKVNSLLFVYKINWIVIPLFFFCLLICFKIIQTSLISIWLKFLGFLKS
jgi:hypothetical protein